MVGAVIAPVLFDHGDVEIPALDFRSARANPLQRTLIESDGRKSRRRRETFLCARVTDIDAVAINSDGMPAATTGDSTFSKSAGAISNPSGGRPSNTARE